MYILAVIINAISGNVYAADERDQPDLRWIGVHVKGVGGEQNLSRLLLLSDKNLHRIGSELRRVVEINHFHLDDGCVRGVLGFFWTHE